MDNHLSVSFYLKCQLSAQTLPDEEKYELALIFSITVTDSSTKMSSTSSFCSEQLSAATLDQVVMLEPVPFLFVIFLINLQHVATGTPLLTMVACRWSQKLTDKHFTGYLFN